MEGEERVDYLGSEGAVGAAKQSRVPLYESSYVISPHLQGAVQVVPQALRRLRGTR